jgi:hypothetical protein
MKKTIATLIVGLFASAAFAQTPAPAAAPATPAPAAAPMAEQTTPPKAVKKHKKAKKAVHKEMKADATAAAPAK